MNYASDPEGLQIHTLAHLHNQLIFCSGDEVEKPTESRTTRDSSTSIFPI